MCAWNASCDIGVTWLWTWSTQDTLTDWPHTDKIKGRILIVYDGAQYVLLAYCLDVSASQNENYFHIKHPLHVRFLLPAPEFPTKYIQAFSFPVLPCNPTWVFCRRDLESPRHCNPHNPKHLNCNHLSELRLDGTITCWSTP